MFKEGVPIGGFDSNMPKGRTTIAPTKPAGRSRIGNRNALFLDTGPPVDGRSVQARVFRDTLAEIVSDLGNQISEAEYQLARRAAALSVECLIAESKQAAGEPLDLDSFIPAVNALNRTFGNLGLKRRQRDVTPDLATYLASKAGEAAE